jgi:hypothetical protein
VTLFVSFARRIELIGPPRVKSANPLITLSRKMIMYQNNAHKMLRAIESERQLQEVLVDFWSNHFNIDIRKQSCGILKIGDDRDVIRPHVLGKFRDLLGARDFKRWKPLPSDIDVTVDPSQSNWFANTAAQFLEDVPRESDGSILILPTRFAN